MKSYRACARRRPRTGAAVFCAFCCSFTTTGQAQHQPLLADVRLQAPTPHEWRLAEGLRRVDGGAEVAALRVAQTRYLDSACGFPPECPDPCNVLLFNWTETSPNPSGVQILLNGIPLGVAPGLPEEQLPGTNALSINGLAAGDYTFRFEDAGPGETFLEAAVTVVNSQPFADPTILCAQKNGAAGAGTGDDCEVCFEVQDKIPPAFFGLFVNGEFIRSELTRNAQRVAVLNENPGVDLRLDFVRIGSGAVGQRLLGSHDACADARPLAPGVPTSASTCDGTAEAIAGCGYQGAPGLWYDFEGTGYALVLTARATANHDTRLSLFRGSCGERECVATSGDAPGFPDGTPGILFESHAGEEYTVLVDGVDPGDCGHFELSLEPASNTANGKDVTVESSAGDVTVSVRFPEVTTEGFTSIDAAESCRHISPVPGHEIVPGTCTVIETSAQFSSAPFVSFTVDPAVLFAGSKPRLGSLTLAASHNGLTAEVLPSTTTRIDGLIRVTAATREFSLFFLALSTVPPREFVRGDCDGDADACSGVSDALKLLNWLFLGKEKPPCLTACDSNGSGDADLTDAVFGLDFCFQGKAPPVPPYPLCGPGALPTDGLLDCDAVPEACR